VADPVLRAAADELEKRASEHERAAAELREAAKKVRREAEQSEQLPLASPEDRVMAVATKKRRAPSSPEKRLAQSEAKTSSPLAESARAAGLTLNQVADQLGIPRSTLSAYGSGYVSRSGRHKTRPVPRVVARKVAKLLGFADWPGGIADR
jgi:CRP-like cAMP-binding protein